MTHEAHHKVINSVRTHFAAVMVGSCFIFFYVIMPVTLGNAADSLGLSDRQLGFVAASFMTGVFLVTAAGIFWLRRYNWRSVLWFCTLLALASYAVPIIAPHYITLLLCLFVSGISCGAAYSVTIACLGDADVPERGFGLTWGVQTFLGVAASYLLPRLVTGPQSLNFSLGVFIGLIVLAALLIPMMPTRGLKDGVVHKKNNGEANTKYTSVVYVGFLVIVLVFLAESGIWAYLDRIAVAGGMSRQFAGTVIAASLLAAAASSFLAAAIGQRWGRLIPMTIAIVTSIFSVYLFYISNSPAAFLIAAVVYGAAWNFGGPYRMALIAEADVTGKYVSAITAMQTLGSVIGPMLAGILATGGTYNHIYLIAAVAWSLAWILFYWANKTFQRIHDPLVR